MSRNEKFYNNYSIKQYFVDIARHKSINFINFLNTIEQNFIIDSINDTTSNVLVIGMGYGREIDIVKKIKPNIKIHALDFNKQFINWGKNNYKNVLFELYDLNSKNVAFNFEKYDLIICFNTLEYLENINAINLIYKIGKNLKKNSVFLFRIPSDNFIQKKYVNYLLSKRSSLEPITTSFDIDIIYRHLIKNNFNVTLFKQPIKFEGFFANFLYSKLWNFFSYLESLIRFFMPYRNCRAIYFKCYKK